MTLSLGCTALWVNDLARSTAFYVDGLGLDVIARIDAGDIQEVIVGTGDGGPQLMLAHRAGQAPALPAGFWKVFLQSDDIEADFQRVLAAGAVEIAKPNPLEQLPFIIALAEDPDGYLIELGQRQV